MLEVCVARYVIQQIYLGHDSDNHGPLLSTVAGICCEDNKSVQFFKEYTESCYTYTVAGYARQGSSDHGPKCAILCSVWYPESLA